MVRELKFLGSAADGGSLLVTLSDFHILPPGAHFCAESLDNKSLLLIVPPFFFKLGMMDCQ